MNNHLWQTLSINKRPRAGKSKAMCSIIGKFSEPKWSRTAEPAISCTIGAKSNHHIEANEKSNKPILILV